MKSRKTDKIGLFQVFSPYTTQIIVLKMLIFLHLRLLDSIAKKKNSHKKYQKDISPPLETPPLQATPMLIATDDCHKYAKVFYSAAYHRVFFLAINPTSAIYWAATLNCLLSSSAGFVHS
jgi:hypothetical protein